MGRIPMLECFDLAESVPSAPPGPSEDWQQGHAAGLAEAEAAMLARQDLLSDQIAQSVADHIFTHAQARRHVLSGLVPLFQALIGRVLPALAQTDFAPHLAQVLTAAAGADTGGPVAVHLHPDQVAAVADVLSILPPGQILLQPDPDQPLGTARFVTPRGETALDTGQVLADASAILSALFDESEPRSDHG